MCQPLLASERMMEHDKMIEVMMSRKCCNTLKMKADVKLVDAGIHSIVSPTI